jgi:RND family efflux transporter MFP subunit
MKDRARQIIVVGVLVLTLGAIALYLRASSRQNHVSLSAAPKPVTVVRAQAASFRPRFAYVGTIEAWNAARVGPQFISAYVSTVLFRPGAPVRRGEVLATLDCRNASAASKEIAARARALEERQLAVEHESQRVSEMAAGNFASKNEAEQLVAKAASDKAEIEGLRASLTSRTLEVDDCILRAPFAGEVSDRYADPGAFVRPGNPIVSVIDRSTVRIVGDAPEDDFAVVSPGAAVDIEVPATGARLQGKISRRAPAADDSTRTVRFEIDLPNPMVVEPGKPPARALPAGATAQLSLAFGEARPATEVPLNAATVRGSDATLYTVRDGVAHRADVAVLGESAGRLFLDGKLAPGSEVVLEGRALLDDGDPVSAKERP